MLEFFTEPTRVRVIDHIQSSIGIVLVLISVINLKF